ncbi:MAG: sulfatase [Candidatus Binatia bacterium]|nr:sulfatase [Candidatus Binatia bacterium]
MTSPRHRLLQLSVLLLLLIGVSAACVTESNGPSDVPSSWPDSNVIVVSIDTLRPDHLGAYGYDEPTSPHLDEFAREGVLFRSAVAPSPTTLPSHTSLFTGLSPSSHGVVISEGRKAPPELVMMAEVLSARGYATASLNDGGYLGAPFGLGQGFEHFEQARNSVGRSAKRSTRLIDRVVSALTWLDSVEPKKFLLFVHSYEVHIPLTPPVETLSIFEESYDGPLGDAILTREWFGRANSTKAPADIQHWIRLYDAAIRSADAGFGALVRGLRERGLYDDSLIVVVSDHGEELGERTGLSLHGKTLFDEALRIPLLVKFPGGEFAGRVVDRQVRLIDVFPTVVGALGLDVPAEIDGESLLPTLRTDDGERPAVSITEGSQAALRQPPWKLYRRDGALTLFNLEDDPGELRDVAAGYPEIVESLGVKLEELTAEEADLLQRSRRKKLSKNRREQLRALGYVE